MPPTVIVFRVTVGPAGGVTLTTTGLLTGIGSTGLMFNPMLLVGSRILVREHMFARMLGLMNLLLANPKML